MAIRDRVIELRRVPASELRAHPHNWRTHPAAQREALADLLAEVGFAGAVLARETSTGLELIDGHLRAELLTGGDDAEIPVLVLDVTRAEADKLLATLDPLAALAETNAPRLDAVLRQIETGSQPLAEMLTTLAEGAGLLNDAPPDEQKDDSIRDPDPSVARNVAVPEVYQVVIECRDEDDQRRVFEQMTGEGYACRVLTL